MSKDRETLAFRVAAWLETKGCTVSIVKRDVEYHIHYTLSLDTKPQPAVRITTDGTVVFPQGSQEAVVFAFLMGE